MKAGLTWFLIAYYAVLAFAIYLGSTALDAKDAAIMTAAQHEINERYAVEDHVQALFASQSQSTRNSCALLVVEFTQEGVGCYCATNVE